MKWPFKRQETDEKRVRELLYAVEQRKHLHVKRCAEVLFSQKRSGTPDEGPDPTHGGSHEHHPH